MKNSLSASNLEKLFPLFIAAGILLNVPVLFNEILEPDGALYASIAKHIALTNDWVNLFGDGHDWLDKPHFPFWLTAISFKAFGINAFAYKLPAFICWLLGIFYTYKLTKLLYNETTAKLAVIIFITSLHVILANFDVRAEGYLTAFIIAATYHLHIASKQKWSMHIVYAALFCAFAVMTKGIFALVTIAGGFVIYWMVNKQWKEFLQPRWWLLVILTFIFIMPELYSLYMQFDLHPEKVVFGTTNVSGLKFFFWDSQFGRFFNTGPITGKGDPSFFLHTTLWAFLPWALMLYTAVFLLFKKIKSAFRNNERILITGSALITFLMFSLSKFQLPHYIVILFPHFAIITANYLLNIQSAKTWKTWNVVMIALYIILIALVVTLTLYYKTDNVVLPMLLAAVVTAVLIWKFGENNISATIGKAVCFALLFSLFMNGFFYPSLMHYQAGMMAGKWLNENKPTDEPVMYKCNVYTFEFYAKGIVGRANNIDSLLSKKNPAVIYATAEDVNAIDKNIHVQVLQSFDYFHISQLTGTFLNPATRSSVLQHYVLASCSK